MGIVLAADVRGPARGKNVRTLLQPPAYIDHDAVLLATANRAARHGDPRRVRRGVNSGRGGLFIVVTEPPEFGGISCLPAADR